MVTNGKLSDEVEYTLDFLAAGVMGAGITIAGMAKPELILSFFDPFGLGKYGPWAPAMMITFSSAVATTFILYNFIKKQFKSPLCNSYSKFEIPIRRREINRDLILGSMIFGIGWSMTGYCPGPAVISLTTGSKQSLTTVLAMFGGFLSQRLAYNKAVPRPMSVLLVPIGIFGTWKLMREFLPYRFPLSTTPIMPGMGLLGGSLIGIGSALLMLFSGKIMGLSGILSGILDGDSDKRLNFLMFSGLISGSLVTQYYYPVSLMSTISLPLLRVAIGGFLIGFGSSLGNGCTSGHGVCGLARMSKRSLIATSTFMGSAFAFSAILNLLQFKFPF